MPYLKKISITLYFKCNYKLLIQLSKEDIMPDIVKINSGKGMVNFSIEEMIDMDLYRWIRHSSKGISNRNFIEVAPFERAASKLYVEKNPGDQVKIAETVALNPDGTVSVVLRVAKEYKENMYNKNDTELVYRKETESREVSPNTTDPIPSKEQKLAKENVRYYPIVFLQNSQDFDGFSGGSVDGGLSGRDAFFEATEQEQIDYLMQFFDESALSGEYSTDIPWGDSDQFVWADKGENLIMTLNPKYGYAGLTYIDKSPAQEGANEFPQDAPIEPGSAELR